MGEREPGWSTVVCLARALGVSVADFDVPPPASQLATTATTGTNPGAVGVPVSKRK